MGTWGVEEGGRERARVIKEGVSDVYGERQCFMTGWVYKDGGV